jgi:hypothetical protein
MRSQIFWLGLWAASLGGCFNVREVEPPCVCVPGAREAGTDGETGGTTGSDQGPDDDGGEPDASSMQAPNEDCVQCVPSAPVTGIDFVPLRTRTESGQTVAHMELTGIGFLPRDHGVLIWEKNGRIAHYRVAGDDLVLRGETHVPHTYTMTDCGLSWVVLDPDWEDNHFIYASKCRSFTHSDVVRMVFDGEHIESAGKTASVVLEAGDDDARRAWHNVGSIGFFDDAERSMWILMGEKDIANNARTAENNLGAVLRIIPRREAGSEGYDPHPDNPFATPGADPSTMSGPDVYAWGLRSPWRGSLDSRGRLVIGDVGAKHEEINLVSEAGQNFGWGTAGDGACEEDCDALTDPILSWDHSSSHAYRVDDAEATPVSSRAIFAGITYEPNARDPYQGFLDDSILFGDICIGYVRALRLDGARGVERDEHVGHMVGITSVAQSGDGHLYATSYGSCESYKFGIGGGIYRVVPRHRGEAMPERPLGPSSEPIIDEPLGPLPLLISQTGIYADEALTQPIDRAFRYEPSLQLYTNGADKDRWVLLPEGEAIDNSDRQAWRFPIGTQFWKTFSFLNHAGEDQKVETRVIRVTAEGYDYAVYAWSDGDATLLALEREIFAEVYLPPNKTRFLHNIPSRFDCRTCHESNRTGIIGFDELRLNAPRAGERQSQLEQLAAMGAFTEPLPLRPEVVSGDDAATREVLGYLHGNCAHCHNSSSNTVSPLSLEHDVALASTINVESQGSGQAAGVRIVPGSPTRSMLFQAFAGGSEDENIEPMPPIGLRKIDADAVRMLRDWITALPAP